MAEKNASRVNDQYNDDDINSSLGNAEEGQQNYSSDNDDVDETQENASQDDENDGTKKTATNAADKNRNIASSYHDNHRVTSRANEANDRLDSGSGGLSAGGVKSATDL